MKKISLYVVFLPLLFLVLSTCTQNKTGPLRVCSENPRYFTDGSGKAIYLTGSHTWNNLVDMSTDDPPEAFDFDGFLNWAKGYNHNFFRLWTWELVQWNTGANSGQANPVIHTVSPLPYERTGPGLALDGKPKFDLTRFNPEYFERLRNRTVKAGEQGFYVSVMLFEGWGLQRIKGAFFNHPYHPENNINGINGDLNGDSLGLEIHTLADSARLSIQKDYVRKVIETVNDLDNILFEISNENHPPSAEWQYHMIDYIHELESQMPKQHPVGMTFQFKGGSNRTLFDSPADWISPNGAGGYKDDPPAGDGSKVILTDTDHLGGIWGNQKWVWKSFLRGLNPIFMDPYDAIVLESRYEPGWEEPVRKSMGYTLDFAKRINLIDMVPDNELASTGYCLAEKGTEYLIYLPEGKDVTVDLSDASGDLSVEWFNPNSNETEYSENIPGGEVQSLQSPFGEDDAVLYLKAK